MFRGFRLLFLLLAALWLVPVAPAASAQNSVVAPPPPPREGTVGPEQLRDFSLGGSNTQRPEAGEQPPAEQRPAPTAPARGAAAPPPTPERRAAAPPTSASNPQAAPRPAPPGAAAPPSTGTAETAQPPAFDLGPPTPAPSGSFDFGSPEAVPTPAPSATALPPSIAEEGGQPTWPWLLALAAVLGGAAFLWSRRRNAAGDQLDDGALAFVGGAPPAAPAPELQPAPPPRAAAPNPQPAISHPKGVGIVSTRLRPWLDVEVHVAAAALTEEELQLHLQLLVANSGSVPARQVGVELVAVNAGAEQERELAAFFARPDPEPRAAEMIAPLDQAVLQTIVRMPRSAFREYAAGDGRVLVPIVALNVAYRAGSSTGRTSRAFLIGRGSAQSERLGPLRTDAGPREFRGLVARLLPDGIRR